jgi:membrane protein YdbS with pleckstrin-like domain
MYERSSSLILRWLKVPPEPHPPHGDPASLRVFRAGKNLFNLRLAGWAVGQALALAGIIFWLVIFIEIEGQVQDRRRSGAVPVRPTDEKSFNDYVNRIAADQKEGETPVATPAPAQEAKPPTGAPATAMKAKPKRPRVRIAGWAGFKRMLVEIGLVLPLWSFPLLWVLKSLGFAAYLLQLPVTYAVRRLDWELRWYMVTDRSLRIRYGVWKVSESTMSFANIQQVVVTQGPVQRLLGLSDVRVQSAGGGGGEGEHRHGHDDDMHLGLFHGVTNGSEIRDLILARLRHFRESGLGDPDEKNAAPVAATVTASASSSAGGNPLAAARELLAEAKALRTTLG